MWRKTIRHYFDNLLTSYSTLLFVNSKFVGGVILLLTLLNPNLALFGFLSWVISFVFARSIGIKKEDVVSNIFTYNSLLVGFGIGVLFKLSFLSLLMLAGASIFTVLTSFAMFNIFQYYFKLPVLNIPFTLVSMMIYLASLRYGGLYLDNLANFDYLNIEQIPVMFQGLLRSCGILVFQPYDIVGLVILITLLIYSRISFFLVISSYYVGATALALFKSSWNAAFLDYSAFNFILIGVAIGGVFLIPSKRSYTLAMIGVLISVFLLDATSVFWSKFGIPVFTLPFNLVVLHFVYVLGVLKFSHYNLTIKESPELSMDNYYNQKLRLWDETPRPKLPFSGSWKLYQGNDGKWTHKGNWKYANDFVIRDDNDVSYINEGKLPEDYYCFGKPVLSPVDGYVVDLQNSLKDNVIGEVDKLNNWGNFIIIRSDFGYYVELSHLKKDSISVKINDYIHAGQAIGKCGNSGYSPEPHLHMQVQMQSFLGATTSPFYFSECKSTKENEKIEGSLEENKAYQSYLKSRKISRKLQFILDDVFCYELYKNDIKIKDVQIAVKMQPDGVYSFVCDDSDAVLYFGYQGSDFIIYGMDGNKQSALRLLFLALPEFPLTSEIGLSWKESLPKYLLSRKHIFSDFLASLKIGGNNFVAEYKRKSENEVVGKVQNSNIEIHLTFDEIKGFSKINVQIDSNKFTLKKIECKKNEG